MLSSPNFHLNSHVLAILQRCNHLRHLRQLQAHLTVLGHSQTQFYVFKLLRFCTLSLSDLRYARLIFDSLKTPNAFLYTAMITAYTTSSDHRSSLSLFIQMIRRQRSNSKPNHFVFPVVLKSSPEAMESYGTESVHTQVLKTGFNEYPVVQTALLDSYSRFSSDINVARQMFDEMSERTVVSWTAMISGYTRVGQVGTAVILFDKMPERDIPAWNALITGLTQNGLFLEAITIFKRLITEKKLVHGHRPNQVTVVSSLSACGNTGMLRLGKSIHGYIYRFCFTFDSFISNSLIDMYGKCGSLIEAKRVFDKTLNRCITSWNSMINCLALHGQTMKAISLFDQMADSSDHIEPDEVTFVGLLNACTHGGLVEKGTFFFDLMSKKHGIEPTIEHYGCLIDLLGRAGRFDEAMDVVLTMKIEPDEVVWGSLLNGCKIHGNSNLGEFAVKKLIEIDPKNGGYGIMLANLYGGEGKWDEVRQVRKRLKEKNAYKTPGCSWIEVDNRVHQFYSVDTTHPRTEEIYSILECLIGFS